MRSTGQHAGEARSFGTSTSEAIYQRVRDEIVSMRLNPGESLKELEKELVREFGVSKTPIREAMLRLGEQGLVEILPQSGTYVALIKLSDVWDAQLLRIAVETALVRKAAIRIDDETLQDLSDIIDDQQRALKRDNPDLFYRLDEEFHSKMANAAGHGALWTVVNAAKSHLDRIRFLSLPSESHRRQVIEEHQRIVAALKTGDPDKAAGALIAHLDALPAIVDDLVASNPDHFANPPARTSGDASERGEPR